jgi:uncharacterized protein with HEPN domain
MKPDERDGAYLWDMLDAARRALRLVEEMDYPAFIRDERTYLAIERLLENIGEAANHVSAPGRTRLPGIPWQGIIGMRNVLAHRYGAIDQSRVWKVVSEELPKLVGELEVASRRKG